MAARRQKAEEYVLLLSCVIPADDRDEAEGIAFKINGAAKRHGCHSIDLEVGPGAPALSDTEGERPDNE